MDWKQKSRLKDLSRKNKKPHSFFASIFLQFAPVIPRTAPLKKFFVQDFASYTFIDTNIYLQFCQAQLTSLAFLGLLQHIITSPLPTNTEADKARPEKT